jgi:hypothetical protein
MLSPIVLLMRNRVVAASVHWRGSINPEVAALGSILLHNKQFKLAFH